MSRTNRTTPNTQSLPVRTGVFTILAVIMAGSLLGYAFGFSNPSGADAQTIYVTGPAPAPVVTPPPAPVVVPVVATPPPTAAPAKATVPSGNTGTNDSSASDASNTGGNQNDIVVNGTSPDEANTIVISGASPTYTSSCCSLPSQNSTPATKDITITGSSPTYTSSCCSLPEVTPTPVTPPVYTGPCCILPEIPFTPFVPPVTVIPPPIIVPPPPTTTTSSCISLNANKSTISPGEAVVLTWATDNGKPVTITDVTHGGTVTTSNNTTGTVTVNPTSETTYHASVPTDQNNPNCTASVKIVPPRTGGSSSCVLLSADKTTITSGEAVTLTWKSNNASPVTVTNVTNNTVVTSSSNYNGTVVVNPTQATTYHASVPGDENNPNCTVSVNLNTGGGGGGGGGGGSHGGGHGSSSHRNVYFSSSNREAAPLSEVYLSEIPYTGLDLGPVGTVLYWAMLVIWSLAAAYLVLFGGIPLIRRRFATFGASVGQALNSNEPAGLLPAHAGGAYVMPAASVPAARPYVQQAAAPAPVMERAAPAPIAPTPRLEMSGEGFKKFASNGSLTIDDIVKGLSRESGMQISAETSTDAYAPVQEEAPAAIERALPQHEAPIGTIASVRAEREAAAVQPEVIGFIGSILAGERDAVFATIRHLNQAGHDAEEFVSHAILALDDAYKARIDGTPVHEDVAQATSHCATSFLERLVSSLTTAVDGSYSTGVTGIKLALTRALAVAQG